MRQRIENGHSITSDNGARTIKSERLPAEWRSWIAENRLVGTTDEQITATLLESGFEGNLVVAEMEVLRDDPYYLMADRIAQRYNKLKSFLDVRFSLAGLAYGAGSIERRSNVSGPEFLERYYVTNRPVILTGLLANSEARRRWTPEYLAAVCGDAMVEIMASRHSDPYYEVNSESHKREVRMGDYVAMVRDGGKSNDYYLVANNRFFGRPDMQRLYSEVPLLPEYLDHTECQHKVFFWFGPGGTVTPLHHDLMNVLVAQVYGRKRFTLIAPEQTPYIYNDVGVYAGVDCGEPDYSRHPLYRHVRPISVVIGPGDILFIPVGWWHYVTGLDVSIMVSYVNFKFPNEFQWFSPNI
jgi:ribosomal protein L16 Arg81 hydroxylase